jgi:hypothetical protein
MRIADSALDRRRHAARAHQPPGKELPGPGGGEARVLQSRGERQVGEMQHQSVVSSAGRSDRRRIGEIARYFNP